MFESSKGNWNGGLDISVSMFDIACTSERRRDWNRFFNFILFFVY